MAENSGIEWTNHTGNIWWGCTEVHEGCDNCYARIFANRFNSGLWGVKAPRQAIKSFFSNLSKWQAKAAKENKIIKVFVGSMMDIFEKPMPLINNKGEDLGITTGTLRDDFFNNYVPNTPNLFYQLLTKRPSNINKYIPDSWKDNPPKNVIFGTSIVNQETTNKLLPQLKQVNGYKFLSIEPQLGEIEDINLEGIDWVIQGGESGAKRRPFNLDWAHDMEQKCKAANVPFFFKQVDKVIPVPKDLEINQFPKFMTNDSLNS